MAFAVVKQHPDNKTHAFYDCDMYVQEVRTTVMVTYLLYVITVKYGVMPQI